MMSVIASRSDSREKMVASAALLIRERGLSGTSFRDVVEHSGAPRGSIYHHFPEGKTQLAEEAVQMAGEYGRALIARAAREGDPVGAVREFVATWVRTLEDTDYRAGCPVVAVATETEAGLSDAASRAFRSWQESLEEALGAAGVPAARSRRLAALTVAGVEGAVVLCRATRSSQPIKDVGAELELTLKAALP